MGFVEKMLAKYPFLLDVHIVTGDNGKGNKYIPVLKPNHWFYSLEYGRLTIEKILPSLKNITTQHMFSVLLNNVDVKVMDFYRREIELKHHEAIEINEDIDRINKAIEDNVRRRDVLMKALESRLVQLEDEDNKLIEELAKVKVGCSVKESESKNDDNVKIVYVRTSSGCENCSGWDKFQSRCIKFICDKNRNSIV